jgi:hypothetical protein
MGDADLDIWMWGWIETPINPSANNVIFVFGHPAMLLSTLTKQGQEMREAFTKWFVASDKFVEHLKAQFNIEADSIPLPAPPRPFTPYNPTFDLAHVGNIDYRKRRGMLAPHLNKYNSVVYGPGWASVINNSSHKGDYIHWDWLGEVWNSAKIILHSAHEDMVEWGFTADSALDAIVNSEALVLADSLPSDMVGHWQTELDLQTAVDKHLADPQLREKAALAQRASLLSMIDYDDLAETFLKCV